MPMSVGCRPVLTSGVDPRAIQYEAREIPAGSTTMGRTDQCNDHCTRVRACLLQRFRTADLGVSRKVVSRFPGGFWHRELLSLRPWARLNLRVKGTAEQGKPDKVHSARPHPPAPALPPPRAILHLLLRSQSFRAILSLHNNTLRRGADHQHGN